MGQPLSFLAADLGAESGRVMVGRFDGGRLSLSEAHRFDSRPVRLPDGLHTDALRILSEIQHGLAAAAAQGGEVAGIGVDTWGVDFALLDADGLLLGNPYHYRDAIGGTVMESTFARVPRAEIFGATGVQLLEINTLFQLLRLQERGSAALGEARRLLMMPDLFSYWLCGRAANEYTIATTSQCLDVAGGRWATSLLERLSLPAAIFGEIVPPGAVLGDLLPHVAEEAGLPPRPVIAVGGHDTALAVAAVPAARRGLRLRELGDLVAARRGDPPPLRRRGEPRRQLHERGRGGGDDPLPQEPVRPVARPGVPPALGAPRRGGLLRPPRRDGGRRPGLPLPRRRGRPGLRRAGGHAGADPGLLPADRPAGRRRRRARSCARPSTASP